MWDFRVGLFSQEHCKVLSNKGSIYLFHLQTDRNTGQKHSPEIFLPVWLVWSSAFSDLPMHEWVVLYYGIINQNHIKCGAFKGGCATVGIGANKARFRRNSKWISDIKEKWENRIMFLIWSRCPWYLYLIPPTYQHVHQAVLVSVAFALWTC